jgi:gamma-glutamyltranspeptidase/glutathione hydrolase
LNQIFGGFRLSKFISRPEVMGTHGMVTSTHYLASVAGLRVLLKGGNAVDAGAATWFALTVLEPWVVGPAGESPILIFVSEEDRVVAVNGQGPAPKAATIEWFKEHGYELIPPDGFLPAAISMIDRVLRVPLGGGLRPIGKPLSMWE